MLEIESEYITTAGYNKLTKDIVANKIKNEELVDKSAICGNISNKSWKNQNNKIWFKLF